MLSYIEQGKSRKSIKEGDIFVIKLEEQEYIYGRVLASNMKSENLYFNKSNFIVFYRKTEMEILNEEVLNEKIKEEKSSFHTVAIKSFWYSGLFKTIGNIPLSIEEKESIKNYLFLHSHYSKKYINIYGKEIGVVKPLDRTIHLGFESISSILTSLEKDLIRKS